LFWIGCIELIVSAVVGNLEYAISDQYQSNEEKEYSKRQSYGELLSPAPNSAVNQKRFNQINQSNVGSTIELSLTW